MGWHIQSIDERKAITKNSVSGQAIIYLFIFTALFYLSIYLFIFVIYFY